MITFERMLNLMRRDNPSLLDEYYITKRYNSATYALPQQSDLASRPIMSINSPDPTVVLRLTYGEFFSVTNVLRSGHRSRAAALQGNLRVFSLIGPIRAVEGAQSPAIGNYWHVPSFPCISISPRFFH